MSELASASVQKDHIVTILRHGQLKPLKSLYFIDMELGFFTLETYILYSFGSATPSIDWDSLRGCSPVIVQQNCSPIARLENWCLIIAHIASGLSFMHSHHYVHRDLKPANGNNMHIGYRNLTTSDLF